MSAEAAVATEAVPKLEVDAEGIPVVEGKTADEVKTAMEKAAKQSRSRARKAG